MIDSREKILERIAKKIDEYKKWETYSLHNVQSIFIIVFISVVASVFVYLFGNPKRWVLVPISLGLLWLIYYIVFSLKSRSKGLNSRVSSEEFNPVAQALMLNIQTPYAFCETIPYIIPIILWGLEEDSINITIRDQSLSIKEPIYELPTRGRVILGGRYYLTKGRGKFYENVKVEIPKRNIIMEPINNNTLSAKLLSEFVFKNESQLILSQRSGDWFNVLNPKLSLNQMGLIGFYNMMLEERKNLAEIGLCAAPSKMEHIVKQYFIANPFASLYKVREAMLEKMERDFANNIDKTEDVKVLLQLLRFSVMLGIEKDVFEYIFTRTKKHKETLQDVVKLYNTLSHILCMLSSSNSRGI